MYLALKWVNLRQVIQNGGSTNLHPPNHRTHNSGSPLSVSHAAQPKTTNFWTFYPTATYVCPINKEASWSTICWLLTLLALLQCVIGNQTLFDLLAAEPFGTAAMCYRQTNTVAHRQKQGMPKNNSTHNSTQDRKWCLATMRNQMSLQIIGNTTRHDILGNGW